MRTHDPTKLDASGRRRIAAVVWAFAIGASVAATGFAADEPRSDAKSGEAVRAARDDDDPAPLDEAKRRQAASVGMVLLAGVLILSVGLLATVVLLGRRARRVARTPLPETCAVDELWYLRTKRPPTASPTLPKPEDDDAAGADDETLPG